MGRNNTDATIVNGGNLSVVIDESQAGSGVTYVGYAAMGSPTSLAAWKVYKLTVVNGVSTIAWANGNADFNNVWDDRATLSYQ